MSSIVINPSLLKKLLEKNEFNSYMINNNIYSEKEIKIGKWINGKWIFRKVYVTNLPTTGNSIFLGFQCEFITHFEIIALGKNNQFVFNGYKNLLSASPNSTNGSIYCDELSDDIRGCECAIIIEYTKVPVK